MNISAVVISFFSAIIDSNNQSVLTALQMLWINLMMDSLAALALATDPPTEEMLDRLPESKKSPLITVSMWKMIIGQSILQIIVSFVLLEMGSSMIDNITPGKTDEEMRKTLRTLIFNTFVFFQLFNEGKRVS